MKIGIGNDHAAYLLKLDLVSYLTELGHEVVDFGHHGRDRVDYPVFGKRVAVAVINGEVERGVLLCGSGVGISIAANRVQGARCVCCSEPYSAKVSRAHNNSNLLAMGSRVVGPGLARLIVKEWLDTPFEGGRHDRRVSMLDA